MKSLVRREWPYWTILVAMFLTAAIVWPVAPEKLPVHWNAGGQIDRYAGKFEGLLLLPLIGLGVYALMLLVPRLDPGRANYARFFKAYLVIRLLPLAVFAVLYAAGLLITFGIPVPMNLAVLLTTGGMFLVLGNYLGKIRPNWFVGIRTPWTLSSKLAWTKTHRLAGWVFMGIGLITIGAAFLPGAWSVGVFLAALLLGSLSLLPYSYFVWRRDPDRIPPAGTSPGEP